VLVDRLPFFGCFDDVFWCFGGVYDVGFVVSVVVGLLLLLLGV